MHVLQSQSEALFLKTAMTAAWSMTVKAVSVSERYNNDTLEASLVPATFLQEEGCRRPMLVHGDANSVTLVNAVPM